MMKKKSDYKEKVKHLTQVFTMGDPYYDEMLRRKKAAKEMNMDR